MITPKIASERPIMIHPQNKKAIIMAVEVNIIGMVTIASRMAVVITVEADMVVASSGLAETLTTVMIASSIMVVAGRTKEAAAATAEVKAMGTETTAIIVISLVVVAAKAATIIEVDINAPGAAAAEDKAEASSVLIKAITEAQSAAIMISSSVPGPHTAIRWHNSSIRTGMQLTRQTAAKASQTCNKTLECTE